ADHERAAVLDAHVLDRTLQQPRRHATGPGFHLDRGLHHRVAGVDRHPARTGAVAVREQRGVAAPDPHVAEARTEILGTDLGEHRLVALPGVGNADQYLGVPLLVALHGGPLTRADAPASLQRAGDAEPDAAACRAPLSLLLAPARVVERGQR